VSPQLRSTASKLRLRPQAQASSRCGGGAIGLAQRQPFSSLRKAPAVLPGPPTVRWGCEVDVHPRSGRPRPSVRRDGDPEPRGARAPVSHWVRARRGGVPANGQGLVLEPNRNFHYSQARPSIGGLVTSVSERQPTSYIRNQYLHLRGLNRKFVRWLGRGWAGGAYPVTSRSRFAWPHQAPCCDSRMSVREGNAIQSSLLLKLGE
jgi:hypothetical protein